MPQDIPYIVIPEIWELAPLNSDVPVIGHDRRRLWAAGLLGSDVAVPDWALRSALSCDPKASWTAEGLRSFLLDVTGERF